MLKICWNWLVHDESPSGANRRREELLKALAAPGNAERISLVVLILRNDTPAPIADPRVVVERVNHAPGAAMRVLYETRLLRDIIQKHRCDVLIQESFPVPNIRSVPILLTIHDLRDVDPAAKMGRSIRGFFAPGVLRSGIGRATRIAAVSNFTKNAIIQFEPAAESKIIVAPNAADHLTLPAAIPPREPNRILYVGHLESRKGADVLFEAFKILHARRPEFRLTFRGHGPLLLKLQNSAVKQGLAENITFSEPVDDAELIHLYLTHSLAAVPSRYEGFSIPLLEALYLNTPVVAARSSALAEVGGAAATFVDSFEPPAWASAIESAMDHYKKSPADALRGRAQAQRYSWKNSAELLLQFMEQRH